MAAAAERTDELVREYLLFRGFTAALKQLDAEIKADREKGFRVSGDRVPVPGGALGAGAPRGGRAPRAGRGRLSALQGLGEGSGRGGGGALGAPALPCESGRPSPAGLGSAPGPGRPHGQDPRIPEAPGPPCRRLGKRSLLARGFSWLKAPLPLGYGAPSTQDGALHPLACLPKQGLQFPAGAPRRWPAQPSVDPAPEL